MDNPNSQYKAFLKEVRTGVIHSLSQTEKTEIGRDFNCQITLNSPLDNSISRHHAEVRPLAELGGWKICPLGHNKDIYVNGQRLSGSYTLQSGDILTFGRSPTELVFEIQIVQTFPKIPEPSSLKAETSPSSYLSPSTWFPLRSKWRDVWNQGQFKSVMVYLLLCVLALFAQNHAPCGFKSMSNAFLAGCLLILAIETVSQLCGRHKPWWLILGLVLITGGLTLIDYQLLPHIIIPEPAVRNIPLEAFLKEAIKALPIFAIYVLGKKNSSNWQQTIRINDPLDGIILAVASATGLVIFESYFKNNFTNIFVDIFPNVAGDLAYSGIFGYYIGLSVIKSPRQRWKILGFGYLLASSLHLGLGLFSKSLPDAIKPTLSIIEYGLLIAMILQGRDQAKQLSSD
ncbi:MAG: FHA domain-containing protein [Crocosphaera sp.]|nr:FHA domain-containing protein [Crocosphaera sp.]